ncbi:MAG: glycoside hydrolase family 28 protein [Bacteroidota bacterium]|nr:glycoside hydrolase family 28 protein [Bacteroidota bacterium]
MMVVILIVSWMDLSANAPAKVVKRYNISEYGAVGDGITLNTKAIQSVIDKCSSEGGGVVIIPKGTFLTGAIFLKKGVNLFVEKEGILKGSTKQGDYPQIQTRWEGIERLWTSALVNAEGLTNFTIDGEGTIDGSGAEWPRIIRQNPQQLSQATRDSLNKIPHLGRPRLICINNCTKVHIANVKLLNQAVWCLHILYCKDVKIENLNIKADHTILSSDGMDIDSSNGVLITGCSIDVNDDCISIKSGKDEDGVRVNKPSENIIVEKCHFGYGHGGVAMGSETSGGIRNVEIRNCTVDAGNWAPMRFKTQPGRTNVVENVTFRDIEIKDASMAFEMNMEWRMVPPFAPPSKVPPVFRNIHFINISGTAKSVGIIHGLKNSPIKDVTFKNCKITAQTGFRVDNAENIDFSGLTLDVKQGDPIIRIVKP